MRMTVRRDGPERFAEGDTVYLSRFVFNPLAAALLMFAVPLAFLVATLIIVVAGLSLDAGSPHTALAALASLPFGFVPAFVVDRRAVRDNPPVLCRTPPSCGNQD